MSIEWQNLALGIEGESQKVTGMFQLKEGEPSTMVDSFIISTCFRLDRFSYRYFEASFSPCYVSSNISDVIIIFCIGDCTFELCLIFS